MPFDYFTVGGGILNHQYPNGRALNFTVIEIHDDYRVMECLETKERYRIKHLGGAGFEWIDQPPAEYPVE